MTKRATVECPCPFLASDGEQTGPVQAYHTYHHGQGECYKLCLSLTILS